MTAVVGASDEVRGTETGRQGRVDLTCEVVKVKPAAMDDLESMAQAAGGFMGWDDRGGGRGGLGGEMVVLAVGLVVGRVVRVAGISTRKSELTRGGELSGIDRRTIGAVRAGGVHGPQEQQTGNTGTTQTVGEREAEVDNVS